MVVWWIWIVGGPDSGPNDHRFNEAQPRLVGRRVAGSVPEFTKRVLDGQDVMQLETVILVVIVFLIAGGVKGVIGFGLPTVSITIIAAVVGLTEAMALMVLPSLVTNFWQGVTGGKLRYLLRRLWLVLLLGAACTWMTSSLLAAGEVLLFKILLGIVICLYSISGLFSIRWPSPGRKEVWLSPVVGVASGAITGVTGVFVMPAVAYLQSLRMPSAVLIQAMGVWFTVATVSVGLSLNGHGLFPMHLVLLSTTAILPALVGMVLGQRFRARLSERVFRKIFFLSLGGVGLYIVVTSLLTR